MERHSEKSYEALEQRVLAYPEAQWRASSLKQSDGFSKPGWTVAFAITVAASLAGLADEG